MDGFTQQVAQSSRLQQRAHRNDHGTRFRRRPVEVEQFQAI